MLFRTISHLETRHWPVLAGIAGRLVLAGVGCWLVLALSGCTPPEPSQSDLLVFPGSTASPFSPAVTSVPVAQIVEEPQMKDADREPGAFPVQKTEEEWKALLTPEQYQITRLKGTERAFTGKYWNTKAPGTYQCVCCGRDLFVSDAKFESGCGWPSFFQGIEGAITTQPDYSIPPPRTEIMCSNCGAHLGHVFEDGPPPTGLRFCVNSASVRLVKLAAEGDVTEGADR